MRERHPFEIFVPPETRYLLLGSFTGIIKDSSYDWYYSNGRNHFWPIIEGVYGTKLPTKSQKQALLGQLGIAVGDIILSCERREANNLDINLVNIEFNTRAILAMVQKHSLEKIYFSSRFVEKMFKKNFGEVIDKMGEAELITLPSPSPRYAMMTKAEKIQRYKELLPKISS